MFSRTTLSFESLDRRPEPGRRPAGLLTELRQGLLEEDRSGLCGREPHDQRGGVRLGGVDQGSHLHPTVAARVGHGVLVAIEQFLQSVGSGPGMGRDGQPVAHRLLMGRHGPRRHRHESHGLGQGGGEPAPHLGGLQVLGQFQSHPLTLGREPHGQRVGEREAQTGVESLRVLDRQATAAQRALEQPLEVEVPHEPGVAVLADTHRHGVAGGGSGRPGGCRHAVRPEGPAGRGPHVRAGIRPGLADEPGKTCRGL